MATVPDPAKAKSLADARLQTHHAAQLATAAGISFLPKEADDSHTNLEWLPALGALASRVIPSASPFRVAVRVGGLELCILDGHNAVVATFPLHGKTVADAGGWVRARVAERGGGGAGDEVYTRQALQDSASRRGGRARFRRIRL